MSLFSRFLTMLGLRSNSHSFAFFRAPASRDSRPMLRARPFSSCLPVVGRFRHNGEESGQRAKISLEELQAQNPVLANEIMVSARASISLDAVRAERNRLKEIDNIPARYSADSILDAKYGDSFCTAQELVSRIAKEEVVRGKAFLCDIDADTRASCAQSVRALPGTSDGGLAYGHDMDSEWDIAKMKAIVHALLNSNEQP